MKRQWRTIFALAIAQLLSWTLLCAVDYIEETRHGDLFVVPLFLLPPILGVVYLLLRRWLHSPEWKYWQNLLFCLGSWTAGAAAFGIPICICVNDNTWIIPQASGGWENFLNGLEYYMFPFFLAGVPLLMALLWSFLEWLWRLLRKR